MNRRLRVDRRRLSESCSHGEGIGRHLSSLQQAAFSKNSALSRLDDSTLGSRVVAAHGAIRREGGPIQGAFRLSLFDVFSDSAA